MTVNFISHYPSGNVRTEASNPTSGNTPTKHTHYIPRRPPPIPPIRGD